MRSTERSKSALGVHPPESERALRAARASMPTQLTCLRCQLIGRRRLLCARANDCKDLPHVFLLGPVLLGGWIATVIAFVASIWSL